jgi:VanZ family protein
VFGAFERRYPVLAFRGPAIGYALLIVAMSSIPGHEFPNLPFFSADKLVHSIEFGLFGMLVYRAFRYPRPLRIPYTLTLVVGIPFAALDELHQLFVPGRHCDPVDFLFDIAGFALFAGLSARLHRESHLDDT